MKLPIVAAIAAIACASCGIGHGGGGLTEQECSAVIEKGYQLQGTPQGVYAPVIGDIAKGCAEADALSREDYDCGMKATTLQEYTDCKIVLDFS